MSKNYSLKRFAKINFLHKVNFELFLQMVTPFRSYIEKKGGVQWSEEPEQFPYDALTEILVSPSDDTPIELFDAFFFVDEMSAEKHFDQLYQDALQAGIDFTGYDNPTPADLALLIWIQNPELLQRLHAGQHITKARKFETFFGKRGGLPDVSKETITALEKSLNEFFHLHRKGRGVRVFVFMRDDGIWFLIRHGLPMKREAVITDEGESKGVLFRPEIYDVLTFLPDCGELQIHTSTVGEKKAYCDLIGTHILGDRDFFIYNGKTDKFSLEPFIRDWRKSLICTDIEGIESVTPIEVRFLVNVETNHQETHRADNLFDAFELEGRDIPKSYTLNRISLRIKFKNDPNPRVVTLCVPNTAIFERDSDSNSVTSLLKSRTFTLNPMEENHDITVQPFNSNTGDIRYQTEGTGILADGHSKRI
jgi:hypothetical protein